jgi:lipid-A-disaccharide synthase
MKIYVIAAERSGDQHAARLVTALRGINSNLYIRAVGGEALKAAGAILYLHYSAINFMGVWEVIKNIPKLNHIMQEIKADITSFAPDLVIHIDASSLNVRLAKHVKDLGIKRVYYIAPKIWAWNTSRVHKIKKLFDKLFVILPFEKEFYARYGIDAVYAGNPTYEAVNTYTSTHNVPNQQGHIALLPGSRPQEIKSTLKTFGEVVDQYPSHTFIVAAVSNVPVHFYERILAKPNVDILWDSSFEVLHGAVAALVVSGTATFETALFNVPQVVCYKTSFLTYHVAKFVIQIPFISLVNLTANREVVKELIQDDFKPEKICSELDLILPGGAKREAQLEDYKHICEMLGATNASTVAAREIAAYAGL